MGNRQVKLEMKQSMWGPTSQLRHSDRIWREIRQNEVIVTPSTRRLTQEKIISVASSTRLRESHSGNNLFHICLF